MQRGGYKQFLARAKAAAAHDTPPSKLVSLLVEQWAWGEMSAPLVQRLAQAAVDDGLEHPDVQKLGLIGSQGKFPGNTHRDLLLLSGNHALVATPPTLQAPIRLKFQTVNETTSREIPLDFLLPHKLFSALYNTLPRSFASTILGDDEGNVMRFWDAMRTHPVVVGRPELQGNGMEKVVPISIHGDGVRYMQTTRAGGKGLEVLSWTSMLSQGSTKTTNYLIFLLEKGLVKDYGFVHTWNTVWEVVTWSLEALRSGLWPLVDWNGNEFAAETEDFLMKGQPLAGGYSAFVFTLRSDIDFLANHFKLNHPTSNAPCALCQADRNLQSRPWTDCRLNAAWRPTIWTAQAWADAHPTCHPFFKMHGAGIDLVFPDLMHCKHLGTDQLLIGSVLTWMTKHYMPGTAAENLSMVWNYMQEWQKVACTPSSVFQNTSRKASVETHFRAAWGSAEKERRTEQLSSLASFPFQVQTGADKKKLLGQLKESMIKGDPFPRLHAKAAETKAMIRPTAAALRYFADLDTSKSTLLWQMVALLDCSRSIDVVVDGIEGFRMPLDQSVKLETLVHEFNNGVTKLCQFFHKDGVYLFNFVPKNHYLIHLAQLGKHMSPKLAWCYQGEDLMNKIKILAQGSFHGSPSSTLGNKVLKKYLIGLAHALSAY